MNISYLYKLSPHGPIIILDIFTFYILSFPDQFLTTDLKHKQNCIQMIVYKHIVNSSSRLHKLQASGNAHLHLTQLFIQGIFPPKWLSFAKHLDDKNCSTQTSQYLISSD
jgi:hypothetical protein